jgi:hypothetical protein
MSSTGKITVNAWVKLNNVNTFQHIVDSSSNTWHLAMLNNIPYFWNGSTYHTTGTQLNSGTWYMITGVQGTTLDVYVNGVLSNSLNSDINVTTNNVWLGRWQSPQFGVRPLNGNIELAQIYNRALSPTEILQNYYGGPIVTSGLVMALDANNIISYPGSGTTWYDLSGNNNHATIYNSPTYNQQGWFELDGIDDYIRTTNTLNLSTTNKVTVMVLFKPNTYSGSAKLVFEHSANFNVGSGGFLLSYMDTSLSQDNQVFLANRGTGGYNIGVWDKSLLNDLNWEISACVFDRDQPLVENLFYLQGSQVSAISNPYPGYTGNNTNNYPNDYFYIGSRGGTGTFANMNVSAVFVYNRVLTADEIAQNYNAYKSRFGL